MTSPDFSTWPVVHSPALSESSAEEAVEVGGGRVETEADEVEAEEEEDEEDEKADEVSLASCLFNSQALHIISRL